MKYNFAALDFETDKFLHGRYPLPFTVGIYDGNSFWSAWGPDLNLEKFNPLWGEERVDAWRLECSRLLIRELLDQIGTMPDTIFYAHNGGKFDYHFMIEHFTGAVKIINARITKAKMGRHEFRDSYSILPVPLATFGGKLHIDYDLMEPHLRETHREEITEYLKEDCVSLYEQIRDFCAEFNPDRPPRLTMASTAMNELIQFHKFDKLTDRQDEFIRPFFFGGRCQCFETGILRGDFKTYDVNSMYPDVMRSHQHPIGARYSTGTRITPKSFFVTVEAENKGAFAQRLPNYALSFEHGTGIFNTTIHELNAAEETGTAKILRVIKTVDFEKTTSFDEFINHFYEKRLEARSQGRESHVIFYKLVMNGAYGKFAQNCADFMDYRLERDIIDGEQQGWEIAYTGPNYLIYERPARLRLFGYYNVATGASITGAARSQLLRGLAASTRPVYSDTDSIICEGFGLPTDDKRLGAWKLEARGNYLAIAGKKTYALLSSDPATIAEVKKDILKRKKTPDYLLKVDGVQYGCVKKASKGVNLSPIDIVRVAKGGEVEYPNPAPNFRLSGKHRFITRRIRATG